MSFTRVLDNFAGEKRGNIQGNDVINANHDPQKIFESSATVLLSGSAETTGSNRKREKGGKRRNMCVHVHINTVRFPGKEEAHRRVMLKLH